MGFRAIVGLLVLLQCGAAFAGPIEDAAAHIEAGRYTEAKALLEPASSSGDPKAQGMLARLYANGWGVPKDSRYAVELASSAAPKGSPEAANVLGNFYRYEKYNDRQAADWFRAGANLGFAPSQANLGEMLRKSGNWDEALKWFRLSADQRNILAMVSLASMYEKGEAVEKSLGEAEKWLQRAVATSRDQVALDELKRVQGLRAEEAAYAAGQAKEAADEKVRKTKLRAAKYAASSAKLSVVAQQRQAGLFTAHTIVVTALDDSPFLLERVVMNNRVNVKGCDESDLAMLMQTGDTRRFSLGSDCGGAVVSVTAYTNRGTHKFSFAADAR